MTPADLIKVDTSGHIEKKNGLSYLSWAWAWTEALKADPSANFHVESFTYNDETLPYLKIGDTAMVWVSVTMFGQKRTCMLPVMNAKNDPISIEGRIFKDKYGKDRVEKVDAFNVNTAIMRCMVKALALHGLGLHIYAGEDLPESVDQDTGEIKNKKPEPKPEPKVEPKPEPKPEKPVNAEGKPGKWQIVVKVKPEAEPKDYVNVVTEMAMQALPLAQTKDDVMEIFKVNRSVFDQMKKLDPDNYEDLLAEFKKRKDEL
jgi:hypothetical protein